MHAAHPFIQHWFNLADFACEEALYDSASLRRFAVGIALGCEPVPDATTPFKFLHLMEWHQLAVKLFAEVGRLLQGGDMTVKIGTIVDATIIAAPRSTKNSEKKRAPEMHQMRKGKQWYFGIKLHISVDSQSGLSHRAVVTPANVHDKRALPSLLHDEEKRYYGDCTYASQKKLAQGKAPRVRDLTNQRTRKCGGKADDVERCKSRVRARVEHVFAVVKHLWGFTKVCYRGLAKNATRSFPALALANIYLARKHLTGQMRT